MQICYCRKEDRDKTIRLINDTFRTEYGYKPTMQDEFLVLLGEENLDNVIIAKDGEKVVSCAAYHHQNFLINGYKIKVSSLGSVCTDRKYRGQGIASKILKAGDDLCKKNNSDLLIISGVLPLYDNHGAVRTTSLNEFTINSNSNQDVELISYTDTMFERLANIYRQSSTRFVRRKEEFKLLIKGSTQSWGNNKNKLYMISKNGVIVGYILLQIDEKMKVSHLKEFGGSSTDAVSALKSWKYFNAGYKLVAQVPLNTVINDVLLSQEMDYKKINQWVSLKVLNVESFWSSVSSYLCEYYGSDRFGDVVIKEEGSSYLIKKNNNEARINEISFITRLFFDDDRSITDCIENDCVKELFRDIGPIPFINIEGMNYQ